MHTLGTKGQTRRLHAGAHSYAAVNPGDSNAPDSHLSSRFYHAPVVDSLVPVADSNESVTPSNHNRLTAVAVAFVLAFVGLCSFVVMIYFLVRYSMRRAAVKHRQASWILRSGQWNVEPKRTNTLKTRTGYSDASSFSAYPYPLSEHF